MNRRELRKSDIETIATFANNDMSITHTAYAMGKDYSTIARRLERVYCITRLNPRKFWELVELLKRTDAMP